MFIDGNSVQPTNEERAKTLAQNADSESKGKNLQDGQTAALALRLTKNESSLDFIDPSGMSLNTPTASQQMSLFSPTSNNLNVHDFNSVTDINEADIDAVIERENEIKEVEEEIKKIEEEQNEEFKARQETK